jgi:hypothetical protein
MQDGQAATPLRPNRFTSATVEPIGYPGSVRLVKRRMGTEEVGKADEALFEEQYRSSTSQHHITYHFAARSERSLRLPVQFGTDSARVTQCDQKLILSLPLRLLTRPQ